MECDHKVSELIRAGAEMLPSGYLRLEIGLCFFKLGLLKCHEVDLAISVPQTKGKLDEASVSVLFRPIGDLASLSQSEVSMTGHRGATMIPAGPTQKAEVFDTIAAKVGSLVESAESTPKTRREYLVGIRKAADTLVSEVIESLGVEEKRPREFETELITQVLDALTRYKNDKAKESGRIGH